MSPISIDVLEQAVQVAGALAILAGFVLAQMGRLRPDAVAYLSLNLVGSTILAVDAAIGGEPGFLLLEGVWALVSAVGLARALRPSSPRSPGDRTSG